MFERVLPSILGFALSVLGLALRASRRSRMLNRIRAYNALADDLQHDPESAALVRGLARKAVGRFVDAEHVALDRRLDPAAVAALLLLVVPAVALLVWTWTNGSGWWKWPLLIFSGGWALLWGGIGLTQLWKAHEADEQTAADS